ncbi:DUF6507 family protein, partial [Nocardiopsis gilva]
MSGWDIDPEGVGAVLHKVADRAGGEDGEGGLVATLKSMGEHLDYAGKCAKSFPVNTALGEFVEHYRPQLNNMVAKTARACFLNRRV